MKRKKIKRRVKRIPSKVLRDLLLSKYGSELHEGYQKAYKRLRKFV